MRIVYFSFLMMIIISCKTKTAENNNGVIATVNVAQDSLSKDANLDMHNAKNSLNWAGTYQGMLPCADCEGINTEVTLNKDETYTISTGYEGKTKIEHSTNNGSFFWLDGSSIKLEDATPKPLYYFIAENYIKQLDAAGKVITGALADNYILKRK